MTQAATLPEQGPLVVSSKVLGHISGGIYRGPAGALKELIANSFDARATLVEISTGRPVFQVVSVRDNGDGMTLVRFGRMVSGGIGDSDKRIVDSRPFRNRPIIGRLGIGILAIAQISHQFEIVSHHAESQTAFKARLWMRDFRQELLDHVLIGDPDADGKTDQTVEDYDVGGYEYEEIPFELSRKGVTITAIEPTEGFVKQLSEEKPKPMPRRFRTFIQSTKTKDMMAVRATRYQRMLWELAAVSPIPYLQGTPITDDEVIPELVNELKQFDFNVVVDGLRLSKPLILDGPTGPPGGPQRFDLNLDKIVWGSRLKVSGYLYETGGSAITPPDLRGILIRVRHVGIGYYDRTFLNYRVAEGPRLAWLSGELYVQEGLEDALTIGRDGFDEAHPHFVALRDWLHSQLKAMVFPGVIKGISTRHDANELEKAIVQSTYFDALLARFAGRQIEVRHQRLPAAAPVSFDEAEGVVYLNDAYKGWPRGFRRRENAERLLVLLEISLQDELRGDDTVSETFGRLLSLYLAM